MIQHAIKVPLGVLPERRQHYIDNYRFITRDKKKLFLFAGDQKIEHLNKDFVGENIDEADADPKHLFEIASIGDIGVFATQYGLISRYGDFAPKVPYLVKVNSKTNIVPSDQIDPQNAQLVSVHDILRLRDEHHLNIVGIGFTLYLGSEYEHIMMEEAAQFINEAQKNGLLSIIWAYPRGKAIQNEGDPHLIAGAAGVANALGADFVKVNLPKSEHPYEDLREAIVAAGNTGVITAGGESVSSHEFIKEAVMINNAGAFGNAVGRNIHQKSTEEALKLCKALAAIVYENASYKDAITIYEQYHYEIHPQKNDSRELENAPERQPS